MADGGEVNGDPLRRYQQGDPVKEYLQREEMKKFPAFGVALPEQQPVQERTFAGQEAPNMSSLDFDTILDRQRYKESTFNPLAESPAGARGLAQITPVTEQYMKEKGMVPDDFDPFNPEDAKRAQRAYMTSLLNRSWNQEGSEEVRMAKALAAYNFGPSAALRVIKAAQEEGIDVNNSLDWIDMLPTETSDYIRKILGYNEDWDRSYMSSPARMQDSSNDIAQAR